MVELTLGEKLKDERTSRNLTIAEVGEKTKIAGSSISDYENDAKNPSVAILCKLAKFYDVTLDYLAGLNKSRSHTAEDVRNQTGLSAAAVERLLKYGADSQHEHLNTIVVEQLSAISFLIENEGKTDFLKNLSKYLLSDYGFPNYNPVPMHTLIPGHIESMSALEDGKTLFGETPVSRLTKTCDGRGHIYTEPLKNEDINKMHYGAVISSLTKLEELAKPYRDELYQQYTASLNNAEED